MLGKPLRGFHLSTFDHKVWKKDPPWNRTLSSFRSQSMGTQSALKLKHTNIHSGSVTAEFLFHLGHRIGSVYLWKCHSSLSQEKRTTFMVKYFKPKLQLCWDLLQILHLAVYLLSSKSLLSFCSVNLCQSIDLVIISKVLHTRESSADRAE